MRSAPFFTTASMTLKTDDRFRSLEALLIRRC
jgi:hypothetical protein